MKSPSLSRKRGFAWYVCYIATVIMLALIADRRVDAWCNVNGSAACNGILSPCPFYCHYYNYWEEFYSPDCPVATCVTGFCWITVPDYSSYACVYTCYFEQYTYCRMTVDG